MRQFRTVLKFEYSNYIKSKSFIIATVVMLLIAIIGGNIPMLKDVFNSGKEAIFGEESGADEKNAVNNEDKKKAAYLDLSGVYTNEILMLYYPNYDWVKINDLSNIEAQIEKEEYDLAIAVDGLNYTLYQKGSDSMFMNTSGFYNMVQEIYQKTALAETELSDEQIDMVLYAQPVSEIIQIGKDTSQSFWLGYALLFVLYFCILIYGQYVSTSVITEKTSKAMELLITSAKPMQLMFGKVIGTGLAGLTQFGLFALSAVIVLRLNVDGWNEISPLVGSVVNMSLSSGMFLYAILFFMLGFFTFSFLYAAFSSTVGRAEDANSVIVIPQMLFIAAFFVAMFGMTTPEASFVKICSYVPFLSSLVMFMRICVTDIATWEIVLGIVTSIIYMLLAGFVSSKIYRVGVMLYGNTPKLKELFRYIKEA